MEFESKTNTDYYLKITLKDDETLEYKTPHDRGTIDIGALLGFLSEKVDIHQLLLKMQLEEQSEQESFEHYEYVGHQHPDINVDYDRLEQSLQESEQEYQGTFHVTPEMREEDIEDHRIVSSASLAPTNEMDSSDEIADELSERARDLIDRGSYDDVAEQAAGYLRALLTSSDTSDLGDMFEHEPDGPAQVGDITESPIDTPRRYSQQIIDELYPIATRNFPDDEQEIRQRIEEAVSTVREGLDVFGFSQDWHSSHPEDIH